MSAIGSGNAPIGGSARSVNYPTGGSREVSDNIAVREKSDLIASDPKYDHRTAWFAGIGAGVGTLVGAGAGAGVALLARQLDSGAKSAGALGAIAGMLLGAVAGYVGSNIGLPTKPKLVSDLTAKATDFAGRERPALPAATDAPVVDETPGIGVERPGITGSNAGFGVELQKEWVERLGNSTTTRTNTNGNPTITIGDVDNSVHKYTDVVVRRTVDLNPLGLGRVLYDPNGYASMDDAMKAFDGRHAVAVVHDGDRYYLADFDAQEYTDLGSGSNSLMISDPRVSAIMVNKGVYYPSNLKIGTPARDGVDPGSKASLFVFAHDQDVPQSIPSSVTGLTGQSIGWYDTNEPDRKDSVRDTDDVRIERVYGAVDEYGGPGFGSKEEAIQFASTQEGNQAVIDGGRYYYVADVEADESLASLVGEKDTLQRGYDSSYHTTYHGTRSAIGGYVHGLRTTDASTKIVALEDVGGLYAPVGDWWVRTRDAE